MLHLIYGFLAQINHFIGFKEKAHLQYQLNEEDR